MTDMKLVFCSKDFIKCFLMFSIGLMIAFFNGFFIPGILYQPTRSMQANDLILSKFSFKIFGWDK